LARLGYKLDDVVAKSFPDEARVFDAMMANLPDNRHAAIAAGYDFSAPCLITEQGTWGRNWSSRRRPRHARSGLGRWQFDRLRRPAKGVKATVAVINDVRLVSSRRETIFFRPFVAAIIKVLEPSGRVEVLLDNAFSPALYAS
jgi:hypothetical protein